MTVPLASAEETRRVFLSIDSMLEAQHRHLEQIGEIGHLRLQHVEHLAAAMQITDGLRRLFAAEAERQLAPRSGG